MSKSEKKEDRQFIPSNGATYTFFIAGEWVYARITNMHLDMLRSTIYTVNEKGDDYDDGTQWIKKMRDINESRAFDLI